MKMFLAAALLAAIPTLPVAGVAVGASAARTPKVTDAASAIARSPATSPSKIHRRRFVVVIDEMESTPPAITVHVGDEVVWVNKDIVPHTVTDRDGRFNSGEMDTGSYRMLVFKQPGMINYYCIYHTMMDGVVTVLPAGAAEPLSSATVPAPLPVPQAKSNAHSVEKPTAQHPAE